MIFRLVLSADVTSASGNLLDDGLPDLYVEVSIDESEFIQRTRVIMQSDMPIWNEELPVLYVPDHTPCLRFD